MRPPKTGDSPKTRTTKFSVTSVTFVAELVLPWPPVQATMSFASTWSVKGPLKMKTNNSNKPRQICYNSFLLTLEYSCLDTCQQHDKRLSLRIYRTYRSMVAPSFLGSFRLSGPILFTGLSVGTKCENVCTDRQKDRETGRHIHTPIYLHTFHWTHILIRGFSVTKYS